MALDRQRAAKSREQREQVPVQQAALVVVTVIEQAAVVIAPTQTRVGQPLRSKEAARKLVRSRRPDDYQNWRGVCVRSVHPR